ncbi:hypothetical protein X777_02886 [Ooceraea biroi]|uniref:Uncharacterized protein n=1 Tax=Ooceraea biroi TaxID=2015173 RepID=A0A026WJX7_OOCBI|nr:hypothetical protein X777_02886 [Ooceraea biroi]
MRIMQSSFSETRHVQRRIPVPICPCPLTRLIFAFAFHCSDRINDSCPPCMDAQHCEGCELALGSGNRQHFPDYRGAPASLRNV